ncbi:hypothetical protein [Yoonia tamlensis]|uniref:hypothetical protein n=1 Tax=Yoonia tamlensis TaxID=390270 RepID=UPI001041FF15|nr:hypothetical protein [Yoonia tamlensis]
MRDFMQLIGIDITEEGFPASQVSANATPSIEVLELMQLVRSVPEVHVRKVFRSLPMQELPRFSGAVMENAAAKALLANFAEENEALRQAFFPDDAQLFDTADQDGPEPALAQSAFTDKQRAIVGALLRAAAKRAAQP